MEITIEQAMNRLIKAMKDDPEYAYGWHANIAMAATDANAALSKELEIPLTSFSDFHRAGNAAATIFMANCFRAKTSLYMLEKLNNK